MNILADLKEDVEHGLEVIGADIVADFKAIKPEVIATVDALFSKLAPFAITAAKTVEDAVASGDLQSSEKASALKTHLASQAQDLGYSLEQQGIQAVLNLLVEFGANFLKLLTGNSLGEPAATS